MSCEDPGYLWIDSCGSLSFCCDDCHILHEFKFTSIGLEEILELERQHREQAAQNHPGARQ